MSQTTAPLASPQPDADTGVKRGARRWLLRETLGNLVLAAILFGVSGRWDWWAGWALVAIYVVWSASIAILILPVNPAMLAERARPHAGTPRWDLVLLGLLAAAMIAEYVVAALDERWGWSPPLPAPLPLIGLALAVLGQNLLFVWAMVSNAWFVSTVRLQGDREQVVASSGPYAFVRHPGYLGACLLHLGTPLLLGSWWALIPAGLSIGVLAVRTLLEDRTLHAGLPGYDAYAARVRYRLLPGIW